VPVRLLGETVRETDALDEAPRLVARAEQRDGRLPGSAASAARAPGTCSQAALCDMSPLPRLSSTSTGARLVGEVRFLVELGVAPGRLAGRGLAVELRSAVRA
jgi:hypothetical protein